MPVYAEDTSTVLEKLETTAEGLTREEVKSRLDEYGRNVIESENEISKWEIFVKQFQDTLVFILILATLLSGFLGEWIDAIAICIILILNAILGYVQEYNAEKSIKELKELAAPQARVRRDGQIEEIPATEVVPGDILVLETGDKIPADARLLNSDNLEVQESVLTGESEAVSKTPTLVSDDARVGDRTNMVFSGTVVTKGRGVAVVTATGMATEVGQIADMIDEQEEALTPLQEKLDRLGNKLGLATLGICAFIFTVGIMEGHAVIAMFLLAVSLAVAAVPEGLPTVITISLAFGLQRLLDKNALIRKLPSVETLGSTTVICTDKTGTLTQNEMTVTRVYDDDTASVSGTGYKPAGSVDEDVSQLLFEIGALCNNATLDEESWDVVGDPTEGALLTSARKAGIDVEQLQRDKPRVDSVPFNSDRKRMSTVHDVDGDHVMYVKGAPDVLLERCSQLHVNGEVKPLSDADSEEIHAVNEQFADDALRVLGFAYKPVEEKDEYGSSDENDLIFVGLQAMIDPPREEVEESIAKCKSAGIRVIMITGDHKNTAKAVGRQVGLDGDVAVDVDDVEDDATNIYARVSPEDKLELIETLQAQDEIVAMTGDGVNDAPALKKADIGVSMGVNGTDVAKEASEMVLTDDNFASIVDAVEEGRGIFDNIKKFVNYLLSSNFGEVLVLFAAMLIGFTDTTGNVIIPLLPLQILWVNLVTDSLPALALGVDPPETGIMEREPRDPDGNIVNANMALNITVTGVLICIATLTVFTSALPFAMMARTAALTTLVVMEVVRLQMVRQEYNVSVESNPYVVWSVVGVLVLHVLAVYSPLRNVLELAALPMATWFLIVVVCAVMYVIGTVLSWNIKYVTGERD